ncbi:MAG: ketohydroxyglutarate aldolase [Candidatus Saccharimonas sp.]|nr:ketohydroxyglutarate aldolase [Planctomycetaceae bacterium]
MTRKISIVVDPDHFDRIVQNLESSGLRVEQTLPSIGAVTGDLGDADISVLRSIEGVKAVEYEAEFQLPPPDSPLQ